MSLKERLLRGGFWLAMGSGVVAVAGLLRNILLARMISVEDFGVVVLLVMAVSVFEMLSNLAVDRMLVQASDGDSPRLQAVAQLLQVIRGGFATIFFAIAAPWLASLLNVSHAESAFLMLSVVPAIRGFVHLDLARFQRGLNYRAAFVVDAGSQIASLLIAIGVALFQRSYTAMVWAILVQSFTYAAISHLVAKRKYSWVWDYEIAVRIFRFGWPILLNGILIFAIFQGDKAFLAYAFNPSVVGWYGAAFMLSITPSTLITTIIQNLSLPVLARAKNDLSCFRGFYYRVFDYTLLLALGFSVFFVFFGQWVLNLVFGSKFGLGSEVVGILGVTQGVRLLKAGQFAVAISQGKTKIPLLSNIPKGVGMLMMFFLLGFGVSPKEVAYIGLITEVLSWIVAIYLIKEFCGSRLLVVMRVLSFVMLIFVLVCFFGF